MHQLHEQAYAQVSGGNILKTAAMTLLNISESSTASLVVGAGLGLMAGSHPKTQNLHPFWVGAGVVASYILYDISFNQAYGVDVESTTFVAELPEGAF